MTQQAMPQQSSNSFRLDDQPGQLLRRAHQRAGAIFHRLADLGVDVGEGDGADGQDMGGKDARRPAAEPAITATQFAVLAKLYESGELSQNLLGRLVGMDRATIQGVVRRLVDRDLVIMRQDPSDRRRILLSLSPLGGQLAGRLIEQAPAVFEAVLEPLSESERAIFLSLLQRLV